MERTIRVTGKGKISVKPDTIRLIMTVEGTNKVYDKAVKESAEKTEKIKDMFENLGFVYLGPVDGHNLKSLEETLEAAKAAKKPVLVHVNTVKGKGYRPAEKNPGAFHGLAPKAIKQGNPEFISSDSFSAVFGDMAHLLEIGNLFFAACKHGVFMVRQK